MYENNNIEEQTNNTQSVKKVAKKRSTSRTSKSTSVDTNDIISKIFGDKKSDYEFGTLQIKSDLVDSLNAFAKEDLAVVIEEALKLIDVERIAKEYEKKKEK